MRQDDTLPAVFAQYQPQVQYVQKVGYSKWTSNCPACSGSIHSDGELPNRCVWFHDDKPLGYCFQCGLTFWPDAAPDWTPPTTEELERWKQEREAEQEGRLRSAQLALTNLRSQNLYVQYNAMMDDRERQWWRSRGIPDSWQNVWGFGWCHDRDAASIPLFGPGYELKNIKYRLTDASNGKYRYHLTGLAAPMFMCDPDMALDNHVIAIEGELKAATTYVALDNAGACVVGLPGLNPPESITTTLAQAERVTLVLDPGSDKPGANGWSPAGRLLQVIGRQRCRVLITPMKIDDGIIAAKLCRAEVRALIDAAVTM